MGKSHGTNSPSKQTFISTKKGGGGGGGGGGGRGRADQSQQTRQS